MNLLSLAILLLSTLTCSSANGENGLHMDDSDMTATEITDVINQVVDIEPELYEGEIVLPSNLNEPLERTNARRLRQNIWKTKIIPYEVSDQLVCSVQTEGGDACIFPFSYNGFVFHGCTDYDVNGPDVKPWCFTSNWWGYCAGSASCSAQTTNGDACVFPFSYNGFVFNGCTDYDVHGPDVKPWCMTSSSWGYCAENQPATVPPTTTAPPPPPTSGGGSSSGGNCGSKPASSRIVGGTTAQEGSWPWQAMLASPGGSQFCGGSLIDEQWVLTASHCVEGASESQIVVRMGAFKITDIARELQVEKIIMHESYHSPVSLAHDVALLKLKTKATLGAGVGLVCLPDANHALGPGKRCYITGWGTLASGGSQPTYLQEASVPIVSQDQCKASYGASSIHDSMICAGLDAGGVDACQGDSGGPMVCEFSGKWYLEGATSWGHGCAAAGKYGVYAKVRYLKSWVENKMSSN